MECQYHLHRVTVSTINQLIAIPVDTNNTIHYDRQKQGQSRPLPGSQVNTQEPATARPSVSLLMKHREVIVVVARLPLLNTPQHCLHAQSHMLWGERIGTMYEQEATRSEHYLIMIICRHKKCVVGVKNRFSDLTKEQEG